MLKFCDFSQVIIVKDIVVSKSLKDISESDLMWARLAFRLPRLL